MAADLVNEAEPAAAVPVAAPASHPRIDHRPALDGLRGLAVVGVLLFHGDLLTGGFLGVDLFFVLSGYLITALLLVEVRDTGTIDLGQFWLRRARRLLPAIIGLLVVVAIYGRFVADPLQWRAIRGDGLATLLYVANWHTIWSGAVYGADALGRSPLEHTWSLAIEEQFYVVWPLVVLGLTSIRRSPRIVLWASAAVAVVGTALLVGLSFTDASHNSLYLGTHTRMAAIGFGAVVASWQSLREGRPLRPTTVQILDSSAIAAAILLLLAWATLGLDDTFLYRGGLTLCGLAVAVIICAVTQPRVGLVGRALSFGPLRGLGFISYGLYLWHWPLFLFLDEARTGLHGWVLFTVRCVASIAVAVVSYEYLEQPIRRSNWQASRVAGFAAVGAMVVVASLVAMSVGAPADEFANANRGPLFTRADGKAPTLGIYGDSVAFLMSDKGLAPKAKELGVSVINAGKLGCEPIGGITTARDGLRKPVWVKAWRNCIDTVPVYPDTLAQRPDVAMVLFGGVQWDAKIDGSWRHPCDPEYQELYRARLTTMVHKLREPGTSVVIVRPAPVVSGATVTNKGLTDAGERVACLWTAVKPLLEERGVSAVDLQARYCTDGKHCDKTGLDTDNRYDGIHYRDESAAAVGAWLVPEVLRAAEKT